MHRWKTCGDGDGGCGGGAVGDGGWGGSGGGGVGTINAASTVTGMHLLVGLDLLLLLLDSAHEPLRLLVL